MKECPNLNCQSDYLNISSSRELEISEIYCGDCGFKFQRNIPEDELIILWNNLPRQAEDDK